MIGTPGSNGKRFLYGSKESDNYGQGIEEVMELIDPRSVHTLWRSATMWGCPQNQTQHRRRWSHCLRSAVLYPVWEVGEMTTMGESKEVMEGFENQELRWSKKDVCLKTEVKFGQKCHHKSCYTLRLMK